MHASSIILIAMSFLAFHAGLPMAHALDENEIYKFEVCKNTKSSFSDKDVEKLTESSRDFPTSYRGLGSYVDYVRKYNEQSMGLSCFIKEPTLVPPHPVLTALTAVTTEAVGLMASDIQNQRAIVEKAATCSALWAKAAKTLKTATKASPTHFPEQIGKSPTPAECTSFVNNFIPQLEFRYKRLRQFLVIADPRRALDFKLSHDRPFSTFIGEKFIGTVWKTDGSLSHLTREEIDELASLRSSLKLDPMSLYYQIISTTPMILFFTDTPNPETIANAFAHLKKQTSADVTDFKNNPPQEIMLYTPYVAKAIQNLPESQRGEACQAVKAIYRNLKFRYEGVPQLLNIAALAFSIPSPANILKNGVRKAATGMAKRLGLAAGTVSAHQAANNLLIYLDGVEMCSRIAIEKNMTPDIDGLCNVQKVNENYSDAQTNMVVGASILGATRVVGTALKTSAIKKQEAEANKKAAKEFLEAADDIH